MPAKPQWGFASRPNARPATDGPGNARPAMDGLGNTRVALGQENFSEKDVRVPVEIAVDTGSLA